MNVFFNFLFITFLSCLATHTQAQQIGWTLLHDKTVVEWDSIPASAAEKLKSMTNRNRMDMHHIAFPHSADGWIMIYHSGTRGEGASYNKSWEQIPHDLRDEVQKLCDKSIHIRQVAFLKDEGWIILYNDNEVIWKNVPQKLAEVILNAYKNKQKIQNIATDRDGGWVVLVGENDFYSENAPEELISNMQSLKEKGASFRQIAFHAVGGWVLLYNKNEAIWTNIPVNLSKRIVELNKQGTFIESISFWSLPALKF